MEQVVRFKLLGEFCIFSEQDQAWKPLEELTDKSVGKKQRAFMTYLLFHHRRKISSAELVERFWPGDSKDPVNSLKNMIHKTRALLLDVFPEHKDLITTQSGGYEWNRNVRVELDVEEFETLYQQAKRGSTDNGLELERQAFELYQGPILPGASEEWLDHINIYFRSVYIDICRSLAIRLQENSSWDEVLRVCTRAYMLAPEEEMFTVCTMQALISLGQIQQAIKRYEEYRDMLWREFNLVPSERVEQVYTLAVECGKGDKVYEEEFLRQMTKPVDQSYSFHCSMLVFRNVIQLELRHMARSNHQSSIAIIRVEAADGKEPSATDLRRLERTLLQGLRAGDPFTRLNMGSFAMLLSGASEENGQKVMDRICRSFHSNYPRSRANLHCRVYPIVVEQDD